LHNMYPNVSVKASEPSAGDALPCSAVALSAEKPLCVAYVSCDFHDTQMAYPVNALLHAHDRAEVRLVLVCYGPRRQDAMRADFEHVADVFVDAGLLSDAETAQRCRELGVDVAVDLHGASRGGRPGIFAHRAAPVQVSWLGYPGSLPAPYFDAILADRVLIPEADVSAYSEQVVHLPHAYLGLSSLSPLTSSSVVSSRSDHGLSDGAVVLCCFSESFTFHPDLWSVWMRLLQAEPTAVLWLRHEHPETCAQLRAHAQSNLVDPDRLIFSEMLPVSEHLERLALADLSLDTLPFSALSAASLALCAGVPHITCSGRSMASRVGASVLKSVGLSECVTHDLAGYETMLLTLIADPSRRLALRQSLVHQKKVAPFFDVPGFARSLTHALMQLHTLHTGLVVTV